MTSSFYTSGVVIQAKQMSGVFVVMTPEGEITGRKDDYACVSSENRTFVMRRELFEHLYKKV